jgi:hypothetical protein
MTGRGMGFCAGNDVPGYMNPGAGGFYHRGAYGRSGGLGAGYGRGRGIGRGGFGRRNMFHATGLPGWARGGYYGAYDAPYLPAAPLSAKEEIEYLKRESDILRSSLKEIDKRIAELNKRAGEEK